jgi:hypothetical protein
MNTSRIMLICGLAASVTASASAQLAFQPPVSLATAQRPDGVAAADFNGDGRTDLAVVTDNPDQIRIFSGDGAGGFTQTQAVFLPSGGGEDLWAGDLDGDGDTDLVVILQNSNSVMPIINTGGAFAPGATAPVGQEAVWLAPGDFDRDGDTDFAVVNRESNSVTVLTNTGGALSATATISAPEEPRAAAAGDFDGDGDLDLAVTDHRGRQVRFFTNTGAGAFTPGAVVSVGGDVRPEGIVATDIDGDGDTDLAVTIDNFVGIMRNTGGAFSFPTRTPAGSIDPSELFAADLDADGDADLISVNNDGGSVSVFENLGGTLAGAIVIPTGLHPEFAAIADLDGNGSLDIAVTNRDSNTTSLIFNRASGGGECYADCDGSGGLDFFDFLCFQNAFGAGDPYADCDGSGGHDFFDFLCFQDEFAAGCP